MNMAAGVQGGLKDTQYDEQVTCLINLHLHLLYDVHFNKDKTCNNIGNYNWYVFGLFVKYNNTLISSMCHFRSTPPAHSMSF